MRERARRGSGAGMDGWMGGRDGGGWKPEHQHVLVGLRAMFHMHSTLFGPLTHARDVERAIAGRGREAHCLPYVYFYVEQSA
jgi:hypothetical protein